MKKKLYSTPVADFVDLHLPASIMDIQSLPKDDGEDGDGGRDGNDSEFGGANDYVGGAWENIWNQQ